MSAKIEIDQNTCTGCKSCFKACFIDVIRWDNDNKKPVAAYQEDCVWCFTCEINCPSNSINVIPEFPVTTSPF